MTLSKYYAKFANNGERITSIMLGMHFSDEKTLQPFIDDGFIAITEQEQEVLTAPSEQMPYMDLKKHKILFKERVFEEIKYSKEEQIFHLEQEANRLLPAIQAGIDAETKQQKLVDIMLEIEELKGNL